MDFSNRSPLRWLDPSLLAALAGVTVLMARPWLTVFPAMDEGVYLTAADRILSGQVIYRDFFQFLAPGYFYLVAGIMKAFGGGLVGLRLVMLAILIAHAATIYAIARRFTSLPVIAPGFAGIFMLANIPQRMFLSHHFVSLPLADLVFLLLLRYRDGRRRALVPAAIMSAICVLFTQTHGILTILAAIAFLRFTRPPDGRGCEVRRFVAWASLPLLAVTLVLAFTHALPAAIASGVKWVLSNYSRFDTATPYFHGGLAPIGFLVAGSWSPRTIVDALTCVFLGYGQVLAIAAMPLLIRRATTGGDERGRAQYMGLMIFAAAGWMGCFSFPNSFLIVQTSTLGYLAAVLTVFAIIEYPAWKHWNRLRPAVIACYGLFVLLEAVSMGRHLFKEEARSQKAWIEAPGRDLWVDAGADGGRIGLLRFLAQTHAPGSSLFVLNWSAWIYHLGGYANPTGYDGLWPRYNSEEQVAEAVRDLEASPPRFIVCDDVLERLIARGDPRFVTLTRDEIDRWPPFAFIAQNYVLRETIGAYRVYEWDRRQ